MRGAHPSRDHRTSLFTSKPYQVIRAALDRSTPTRPSLQTSFDALVFVHAPLDPCPNRILTCNISSYPLTGVFGLLDNNPGVAEKLDTRDEGEAVGFLTQNQELHPC